MATRRPPSPLKTRRIVVLLLATGLFPGLLCLSVGIVALALSRQAFDVVFGILVLVFASTSITGALLALAFLRRSDKLVRLQTHFVANVSHELRTPLAGIHLLVETLALGRAETAAQRTEVLGLLQGHIARLEELVERILNWQCLESGRGVAAMTPQPVKSLVEEAVAALSGLPHARETRVQLTLPSDLPQVSADRNALVDALKNLIDNALKFGGATGSVEVIGRHGGDEVIIEVHDQGPGIPEPERTRIFERFYRVPGQCPTQQGIGLGLAIVRQVVEAHRGRVHVEGQPGGGSAFILHLPAASPEATASPAPSPPTSVVAGGV